MAWTDRRFHCRGLEQLGREPYHDGAALDPSTDLADLAGFKPTLERHRPDPRLDLVSVPPGEACTKPVSSGMDGRDHLEPNAPGVLTRVDDLEARAVRRLERFHLGLDARFDHRGRNVDIC